MRRKVKYGLFLLWLVWLLQPLPAQNLIVQIKGIRSAEGVIIVSLFANAQEFADESPRYEKVVPKTGMRAGQLMVVFQNIPPGSYGMAVLDDTNENGKMDYKILKPTEGYGFSDFYPRKLQKPTFEKFQFSLTEEDKAICVSLLYW